MTKLKDYLKEKGVSQKWLAKKIKTTETNLSSIVNGKSTPTLRLAYEIEKNTSGEVTIYEWVKKENDEKKPT